MVQDTTVTLPQLTVILEGLGTINTWSILVNGIEVSSNANPIPVNVLLNDAVVINVNIMNSDSNIAPDLIYGEFVSAEVTPIESLIQWSAADVPVDSSIDVSWSFAMPSNNVTATINAGHETGGAPPPVTEALMVSDIVSIDPVNTGNASGSNTGNDILFGALDGTILYNRDSYQSSSSDSATVVPAQPLLIELQDSATIKLDGIIPITYDGGIINVYLPLTVGVAVTYYIASDGSSYYDEALTSLARAAP